MISFKKPKLKKIISNSRAFLLALIALTPLLSKGQNVQTSVHIIGQMKEVMWKGELYEKIILDTISPRAHLYGMGPVSYLSGEILILDGTAYKSSIATDSSMIVEETFKMGAPFFGYSHIPRFSEQNVPDSIQNISQLENYIDQLTKEIPRPFMFKLQGMADQALIHVVNLPKGTQVSSPAEAHQGQVDFELFEEEVEILGFFSTEHKTIFTHHDTFLHMHLITTDRSKMGHLDKIKINQGSMKLYLPME